MTTKTLTTHENNGVAYLGFDLIEAIWSKPPDRRPAWATHRGAVQRAVAEFAYFFRLMAAYPDSGLVPTERQDDVWHEFMLHPVHYWKACMEHAGQILDHHPGIGDPEAHEARFRRTQDLWLKEFGIPHPARSSEPGRPVADCYNSGGCSH
jgi:hypothetical protein